MWWCSLWWHSLRLLWRRNAKATGTDQWTDQFQPLPVLPNRVAVVTAGDSWGGPAPNLCLSLLTARIETCPIVCTQLLLWELHSETIAGCYKPKCPKLNSFPGFLKNLFGRIHEGVNFVISVLLFMCYCNVCLLQSECFIGNSDGLRFCAKLLNLCCLKLFQSVIRHELCICML